MSSKNTDPADSGIPGLSLTSCVSEQGCSPSKPPFSPTKCELIVAHGGDRMKYILSGKHVAVAGTDRDTVNADYQDQATGLVLRRWAYSKWMFQCVDQIARKLPLCRCRHYFWSLICFLHPSSCSSSLSGNSPLAATNLQTKTKTQPLLLPHCSISGADHGLNSLSFCVALSMDGEFTTHLPSHLFSPTSLSF